MTFWKTHNHHHHQMVLANSKRGRISHRSTWYNLHITRSTTMYKGGQKVNRQNQSTRWL